MPSSFKKYQGTITTDATAVAGDIVSTKTAYGSAGTKLTGSLALTGDAVVGEVLSGKKFYKDSPTTQLTGTMTNVGAQSITPAAAGNTITAGYHNGSGGVSADADFVASNIKTGVVIWGVTGTLAAAPTSIEAETSVNDGAGQYVYYSKCGKVYILGPSYFYGWNPDTGWLNDTNTQNKLCTMLGITGAGYYVTQNMYRNSLKKWTGSAWSDGAYGSASAIIAIIST